MKLAGAMRSRRRTWSLPPEPWVLHCAPTLGNLTDRWIDTQARAQQEFGFRILGRHVAEGAEHEPHWLDASQRPGAWLGHRLMYRSRGLSTRLIAPHFSASPPALIHAHYGIDAATLLPFADALDRPLVASFYGFDATETRFTESARWRRAYRRLFGRAGRVLVEGPTMAERVRALGCRSELIEVIRLPADADSLAAVSVDRPDCFTIVAAGRFIEKKGFDTAIDAFASCLPEMPDAILRLVGGGELDSELRARVRSHSIESSVEFSGRLPFGDFMSAVGSAHLALYPSRVAANGDSEGGAPVGLIEAQWLGVPSIVSDHDDLPFVTAPEGSVVLDPGDVESWAEAVLALYRDPERLAAMSEAASRFARQHHSPKANAEHRERVYREVTDR